jgi:hypothetical protein
MKKGKENRRERVFSRVSPTNIYIPSCIFNAKLSSFETIVKFLKESYGLSIQQISELLNKKKQSAWRAYKEASLKFKDSFEVSNLYYPIPVEIFKNSGYSLLETLVLFLKDECGLTYSEIASLLARDDRTIWTVYNRTK